MQILKNIVSMSIGAGIGLLAYHFIFSSELTSVKTEISLPARSVNIPSVLPVNDVIIDPPSSPNIHPPVNLSVPALPYPQEIQINTEQQARFEVIRTRLEQASWTGDYTIYDLNTDLVTVSKEQADILMSQAVKMMNDKTLDSTRFLQHHQ